MPRLPNAKAAFLAGAALLALPALPHLGDWLRLAYSFYDSYLGGTPAPAAWLRAADCLWIGLCLAGMLWLHRRLRSPWAGWQIGLAAAAFALVPPFGSHDAVYYFRLAERWAGGVNPYAAPFSVFNPFLGGGMAAVGDFLPYPPLWVLACGALYLLAGGRLLVFFGLLKLLLGACHAGNFLLLRRLLAGRPSGEAAAWAYLAHPLFLLEGLSMMHFDLLWLLACLAAAWQLRQGRWWPAVLAGSAAFWLKYSAAFALPLFLPALWEPGLSGTRRFGRLAGGAAVVLGVGAAAGWPFGHWQELVAGGLRQAAWAINSPLVVLRQMLPSDGPPAVWLKAALALAALALLLAARPKPDPRTHDGAAAWTVLILLAYLLVASPVFWPWYSLWPLFFAQLLADTHWSRLGRVAAVFAAASFLYYPLLFLVGHIQASYDTAFQAWYAVLSHGPALALLAVGLRERAPRPAAA